MKTLAKIIFHIVIIVVMLLIAHNIPDYTPQIADFVRNGIDYLGKTFELTEKMQTIIKYTPIETLAIWLLIGMMWGIAISNLVALTWCVCWTVPYRTVKNVSQRLKDRKKQTKKS